MRTVGFAESSVSIRYDSPEAGRLVDFLYRDVADRHGARAHTELTICRDGQSESFSLFRDGALLARGLSWCRLASILMDATIHDLIDDCHDGLVLHAAALSREGAGLLLPGPSGAGKSSLVTWLVSRNFNYLTDEIVQIRHQADVLEAFTRPIGIKPATLMALRAELDLERHGDAMIPGPDATMIAHRVLNPHHGPECPTLRRIVFPDYRADATVAMLERLSSGQTGLGLMACLLNARNLEGHGLSEVARIARGVPAYRLSYGHFHQLEAVLDELTPARRTPLWHRDVAHAMTEIDPPRSRRLGHA